ncbi:P-loop containing nucleoside triphosphate hydrolase domain-containing protein [Rozella allomycis CSF55]|uniref:p-loop containing nucleoside triphosphate hydrolase domain-containing protein n=1 Tax=Rozella allomycis (strain CSF55) TaxID=988480 RepID=A0A075B020_ROZAC|nr:P-loop containing nucleoside triphosphate hydrolase domain-containing protein [Rozella allomycis CSF55]|eukprot:EPZ35873.1 P-loop containing nucleoside triphosphate hydrolase domain-containing protein [Rozella allomycis CSF55]
MLLVSLKRVFSTKVPKIPLKLLNKKNPALAKAIVNKLNLDPRALKDPQYKVTTEALVHEDIVKESQSYELQVEENKPMSENVQNYFRTTMDDPTQREHEKEVMKNMVAFNINVADPNEPNLIETIKKDKIQMADDLNKDIDAIRAGLFETAEESAKDELSKIETTTDTKNDSLIGVLKEHFVEKTKRDSETEKAKINKLEAKYAFQRCRKGKMFVKTTPKILPDGTKDPENSEIVEVPYGRYPERSRILTYRCPPKADELMPFLGNVEYPPNAKCARIGLIGPPNAGKSTLLNKLIGEPLSAVSSKAQTTRKEVVGIWTENENQIIFYDTPGIPNHYERGKVKSSVAKAAWDTIEDRIQHNFCFPVSSSAYDSLRKIFAMEKSIPVTVLLNKIDLKKEDRQAFIEDRIKELMSEFPLLSGIIPISVKKNINIKALKVQLLQTCVPSPWEYPGGLVTPMSKVDRAISIVQCTSWRFHEGVDTLELHFNFYVIDEDHIKIVVGSKGVALEYVRYHAEKELSQIFNCQVDMHINVRHSEKMVQLLNIQEHY